MKLRRFLIIIMLFLISSVIVYYFLPHDGYLYGNNGKLIINEIMSKNTNTYMDDNMEYSDFIELYNGNNFDINLLGYHLSDSLYETDLWKFPDITIKAKSYLLVFASGKNRCNNDVCHTNFRLSSNGEVVTLTDNLGNIISKITYKKSKNDTSYGYNGRGYVYYEIATPLNVNSGNYSKKPIGLNSEMISVYINEYMSSNTRIVTDNESDYSDFIELYNYSDIDIDLSGYYLSDDINKMDKYMLEDIVIKAHDYLIIYTNGKDKVDKYINTNFSIGDNDKHLILSTYDGLIIDKVDVVSLKDNISYGRYEDKWCYFMYPTVGYENNTKCFLEFE